MIRDLYYALQRNQIPSQVVVYRAQRMHRQELDNLQHSINNLISINSFFSTTRSQQYVSIYLDKSTDCDDKIEHVLFEIDATPCRMNTKPFADIADISNLPEEEEVLFMAGCIFRIDNVRAAENGTHHIIHLTLCNQDDHILNELYLYERNELGTENNFYTLGDLLRKSGKLAAARKCFLRRLNELPNNDESLQVALCYYMIGRIIVNRAECEQSIEMLNKALMIFERIIQSPTKTTTNLENADIYMKMGHGYWKNGDTKRALASLDKAKTIYSQIYTNENENVAMCLNYMGLAISDEHNYAQALVYYEASLAIREKILPPFHKDLSVSHNNIATTCTYLKKFDLALQHFEIALEIELKSLPLDSPSLSTTYANIGTVYQEKGDYDRAKSMYLKVATILSNASLPQTHPAVIQNKIDSLHVNARLWFSNCLKFFRFQ